MRSMLKSDADFADFARRKDAFVAKWGDALLMAAGDQRRVMLAEAAPLAKSARLPVEQFVSRLAKRYVEGT